VLAAGVGGLLLAPPSQGGPLAHLGFAALAVALLLTSTMGYVAIRQQRVAAHRAWMTRSYALIFTAVTFRAWLGILAAVRPGVRGRRMDVVVDQPAGRRGADSRTITNRGRSAALNSASQLSSVRP